MQAERIPTLSNAKLNVTSVLLFCIMTVLLGDSQACFRRTRHKYIHTVSNQAKLYAVCDGATIKVACDSWNVMRLLHFMRLRKYRFNASSNQPEGNLHLDDWDYEYIASAAGWLAKSKVNYTYEFDSLEYGGTLTSFRFRIVDLSPEHSGLYWCEALGQINNYVMSTLGSNILEIKTDEYGGCDIKTYPSLDIELRF